MPNKLVVVVIGAVAAVGLLVGLATDLGAGSEWIAAAVALATVLAVAGSSTSPPYRRNVTVGALMLAIAVAAAAFSSARAFELSAKTTKLRSELREVRAAGPSSFDYFVEEGEADPNEDFSSAYDSRYAYARTSPDLESRAVDGGEYELGTRVRVTCYVKVINDDGIEKTWLRLVDGSFMQGSSVRGASYSGSGSPPRCPGRLSPVESEANG